MENVSLLVYVSKFKISMNMTQNYTLMYTITPFKPIFTFVIFIHYKPRIAGAILDL